MKGTEFLEIINDIDDDLIIAADSVNIWEKRRLFKQMAVAACVILFIAAVLISFMINNEPYDNKNAIYTAKRIGALFEGKYLEGGTSSYTKIYVPSADYLYNLFIPEEEMLVTYGYGDSSEKPDEEELRVFISKILEELTKEEGVSVPLYTIEEESVDGIRSRLSVSIQDMGGYYFYASQNNQFNTVYFYKTTDSPSREITLGNEVIKADQRQSDEEILDSLSGIREKLFEIFGRSFSDAKVVRYYNSDSKYGVSRMVILYYNESDHYMNKYLTAPVTDSIQIEFENMENWVGDKVSDSVLTVSSIYYRKLRVEPEKIFAINETVKMITLKEAEKLLNKGYVFGGHSCPICMALQKKVNFRNYDFVGFEYVIGYDLEGKITECIPFYAFYKKIGTADNGNKIYARTYVPAIEASGYKEYFNSQKVIHKR